MSKMQEFRKKIGLSQQELAEFSKVSIGAVQSYEQNRLPIEGCRLSTLLRFADVLNVKFYDLIEDENLREKIIAQLVQGAEPGPLHDFI